MAIEHLILDRVHVAKRQGNDKQELLARRLLEDYRTRITEGFEDLPIADSGIVLFVGGTDSVKTAFPNPLETHTEEELAAMTFAQALREFRLAAGLTQAELGKKADIGFGGVDTATINRMERMGSSTEPLRRPRRDTLDKLMVGLGWEPNDPRGQFIRMKSEEIPNRKMQPKPRRQ
jgi:hypothetical protein